MGYHFLHLGLVATVTPWLGAVCTAEVQRSALRTGR
jgi:hypothetical protein